MNARKVIADLERLQKEFNGVGIDTVRELVKNPRVHIKVSEEEKESTPPEKAAAAIERIPELLQNLAPGQPPNPKEIAAGIGLNPKSPTDVQKVRKVLQSSPLVEYQAGTRSSFRRLLSAPGE